MSIEENRCPSCNRILQRAAAGQETILACPCGYAKTEVTVDGSDRHGIVAYTQKQGRTTVTTISEPQRD